eukprot:13518793-Ditylum_brightwellii.AAC.1
MNASSSSPSGDSPSKRSKIELETREAVSTTTASNNDHSSEQEENQKITTITREEMREIRRRKVVEARLRYLERHNMVVTTSTQ